MLEKVPHPMTDEYRIKKLIDHYETYGSLYIGVDFDDTISPFAPHTKKEDFEPIINLLQRAKRCGLKLCLWTVPFGEDNLQYKIQYCKDNGIEMDYINDSPLCKDFNPRKPHFNLLIDDSAGLESTYRQLDAVVDYIEEKNGSKPFVRVFSHRDFEFMMKEVLFLNEENIEKINYAVIDIVNTDECLEHYMEEDVKHVFKQPHPNVLNLTFDDLTEDREWKGHLFKAMTEEQAKETYDFIKRNIGKDFYISCWAGRSRSQAVCRFILDCFPNVYDISRTILNNPPKTPNQHVLTLLKREFYKDNNMF